jgi:CheY-like chemotaxis protein
MPPTRVLVVDDNPDSVQAMVFLLEIRGYEARGCLSGSSCLELAEEWRPHIVLLDLGMPTMDGFEVARRLQEVDGLTDTVLIAWTGFDGVDDQERTRQAGFAMHLVKPVDPEVLLKTIAAFASPRI